MMNKPSPPTPPTPPTPRRIEFFRIKVLPSLRTGRGTLWKIIFETSTVESLFVGTNFYIITKYNRQLNARNDFIKPVYSLHYPVKNYLQPSVIGRKTLKSTCSTKPFSSGFGMFFASHSDC